jgi:hypothetical protein
MPIVAAAVAPAARITLLFVYIAQIEETIYD